MALSPLHQRFVAEYLVDLNATKAATRAGYSARTAKQQGSRVLLRADVQAEVTKKRGALLEKLEITAERIELERARLALYDIGDLAMIDDCAGPADIARLPAHVRQAVKGWKWDAEGRFTPLLYDKNPHLTALEKIKGMYKHDDDGDRAPFSIHIHPFQPKTEPAK